MAYVSTCVFQCSRAVGSRNLPTLERWEGVGCAVLLVAGRMSCHCEKRFLVWNMAHSSLVVPVVASQGFTRNEVSSMNSSVTSQSHWGVMPEYTGYLVCPSGHRPGLDKEERKGWVVVKNADSLAAPAVTGQGASKKQSSQLSIESQGLSGRRPGQLEWFTRVNLCWLRRNVLEYGSVFYWKKSLIRPYSYHNLSKFLVIIMFLKVFPCFTCLNIS